MDIEKEVGGFITIKLPHLEIQIMPVRAIGGWLTFERDMPYIGTLALLGLDLLFVGVRVVLFGKEGAA